MCEFGEARGCKYRYIHLYKKCIYIHIKTGISTYSTYYLCISVAYLFLCLYSSTCIKQMILEKELKVFTDNKRNYSSSSIRKLIFDFALLFLKHQEC